MQAAPLAVLYPLSRRSRRRKLRSMARAPKGAVTKIATTATVSTTCPQARPMARGTPPMAACTVALGR